MQCVAVVRIVAIRQTFADIPTVPELAISIGVPVMPIAATFPAGAIGAAAEAAALACGLAVLAAARRATSRTTLVGPWSWAVAAVAAWSGAELAASLRVFELSVIGPLRLAAMTVSFCPVVALLGAKRPQHVAWNFVVLSLWAITALPAAENLFLHRGREVAMGDARGCFLWLLILLGPINFVPTRYWLPSLLLAGGQVVALSPYLPLVRCELVPEPGVVGLLLATASLVIARLVSRKSARGASAYDRLWLDFRDAFGLLWALRVQERLNALARQENWGVELTWAGFRISNNSEPLAEIPQAIEPGLRTSLEGLLRRFVSNEWIEERLRRPLAGTKLGPGAV